MHLAGTRQSGEAGELRHFGIGGSSRAARCLSPRGVRRGAVHGLALARTGQRPSLLPMGGGLSGVLTPRALVASFASGLAFSSTTNRHLPGPVPLGPGLLRVVATQVAPPHRGAQRRHPRRPRCGMGEFREISTEPQAGAGTGAGCGSTEGADGPFPAGPRGSSADESERYGEGLRKTQAQLPE